MLQITLYAYSEFTLDMSILLAVLQVAILSQHSLQPIDILTIVAIWYRTSLPHWHCFIIPKFRNRPQQWLLSPCSLLEVVH